MGRRVRFKGAKNTPKKLERELLERSRQLAEDPGLLIPRCGDGCRRCEFDKLLKKMRKVAKYADDPDRLVALASKGDPFVRAYAAAISLQAAERIPYLATAKLPSGEVSYAVRGKVENKMLIGAQHFNDPDLRLLLYWNIARERGLHIYALEGSTVCSASPKAPPGFVEEAMASAPYRNMDDDGTALEIEWLSAGKVLRVAEERLGSHNLLNHLAGRIAAVDRFDDFTVRVRHDLEGGSEWKDMPLSEGLLERYRKEAIDDRGLVTAHLEEKREAIRASGKEAYVIGDALCPDLDAFISALRGGREELEAVSAVLRARGRAVVLEGDRASEAVAELWDEEGEGMLRAVSDAAVAGEVLGESLPPAQAVAEAARRHTERNVLGDLPRYSDLGEVASLADRVAREYKVRGAEEAVRTIERIRPSGHRRRAVSRGFLIALGDVGGWQFSKEEEEFGQYLSAFAERLLGSIGDEYDRALRDLVTASGSNETVA